MEAIYIKEFGGRENLEIREVENPPAPVGKQVLVRVYAAGLNRADILQRKGLYPPPPGFPERIPGLEFAGEVAKTGKEVKTFKSGDRVFGITAGGGQAELLITNEDQLAKIPDSLDYANAAAVPEAFITAQDAVFVQGGLKPSETVLIHAVGSGVGLAALQLAKANGARAIGTSRTASKLEACGEFGLDAAIDTGVNTEFSKAVLDATEGKGVDVILDLVGAAFLDQNLKSLSVKGRLLLVGLVGGAAAEFDMRTALQKRLTLIGTVLRGRSDEEKASATARFSAEVLPLFDAGKLRPNLDRAFNPGQIREAHDYLESNANFGKAVVVFRSGSATD